MMGFRLLPSFCRFRCTKLLTLSGFDRFSLSFFLESPRSSSLRREFTLFLPFLLRVVSTSRFLVVLGFVCISLILFHVFFAFFAPGLGLSPPSD